MATIEIVTPGELKPLQQQADTATLAITELQAQNADQSERHGHGRKFSGMKHRGKVIVKIDGKYYLVPEEKLESCRIPVAEIIPEILKEIGAPSDLDGPELEDKLSSWENPVIAYLPSEET